MKYHEGMKTKKVTVTMPYDLIEQVKLMAENDGRSFSNLVAYLVSEGAKKKAAMSG